MRDFDTSEGRPIGLIFAMREEFEDLRQAAEAELGQDIAADATGFTRFVLSGTPVIATECGIGKVNAAMAATRLIEGHGCRAILFIGVAGGLNPSLAVGDVVIADRLIQHDYGAMIEKRLKVYRPGRPPLPGQEGDPAFHVRRPLIEAVLAALKGFLPPTAEVFDRQPEIRLGAILSGDYFLQCSETRDRLCLEHTALAVEMEGAAVAQVAERLGADLLVIRAISDLAGEDSGLDFPVFLSAAAAVTTSIALRLLPVLRDVALEREPAA